MAEETPKLLKILEFVSEQVVIKHGTALIEQFDNGYFWACKDIQQMILKMIKDDN